MKRFIFLLMLILFAFQMSLWGQTGIWTPVKPVLALTITLLAIGNCTIWRDES